MSTIPQSLLTRVFTNTALRKGVAAAIAGAIVATVSENPVAERGLTEAVGDALVAFVEWAWPRGGDGASLLLDKLAETLRPDPLSPSAATKANC